MIVVTEWVAALPGAIGRMAAFGIGAADRGKRRDRAARAVADAAALVRRDRADAVRGLGAGGNAAGYPDLGDGHNVGVRGRDGRLHLMRTAKDAFLLKEWLAADADARSAVDASLTDGVSCDDAGCVAQMADGGFVTLALSPRP